MIGMAMVAAGAKIAASTVPLSTGAVALVGASALVVLGASAALIGVVGSLVVLKVRGRL